MGLFIPWKLISIQEMPSDTVGDRSEVTALDSQAVMSRGQAEFQHQAAYNVQTLTDVNSTIRKKPVMWCSPTHSQSLS